MPRALSAPDRRFAEEAVRRGLAAANAIAQVIREFEGQEGAEPFAAALVRNGVLTPAQVDALAATVGQAPVPLDEDMTRPPEIAGYRILERLGRGGMGSVYRAVQEGLEREVALKVLRRPLAQDQQQVERLRREARLIGALDHPNIVRGVDTGQSGTWHYFAMEFVEGETLRDRLLRGPVPEAEALRLVEQIASALDHAHRAGVVHRDVKPGNIILAPDGNAKLTDFGLAKGPTDFALTQSGVTIGTPQYLSPEQARDPSRVDIQTDLYSLGATAYHMLAGVPPHASETLAGLVTKVLYEKPRTSRQVNPRVSEGASFLVEKLMAKQKRHRYATPRDVLVDLRALAQGRSIVPRDWAGDFEVHAERRRSRRIAAWATGAVAAAAVAAGWMQWRAERDRLEAREKLALAALQQVELRTPHGQEEWRRHEARLREFLEEYGGTAAAARAERGLVVAADRLRWWSAALALRGTVRELADARKFVIAIQRIDERLREFERAGDAAREAASYLQDLRDKMDAEGQRAAEEEVAAALERAEGLPPGEGAHGATERLLRAAEEEVRANLVSGTDRWPLQRLAGALRDLGEARAIVEDSYLGSWRAEAERLFAENRFVALAAGLDTAAAKIAADEALAATLSRLPRPAAEDLRSRVQRERARIGRANAAFVDAALAAAAARESRGDLEGALATLEEAATLGVGEHHDRAREAARGVEQRRTAQREAQRRRLDEFWLAYLGDLARRDLAGARARVDALTGEAEAAPSSAMAEASMAARLLLDLVERRSFERVRARIDAKEALLDGLQFDEGDRFRYPRVSNARVRASDLGWVVVFDAPGQPGLQGTLHRLALPLLLRYAGLAEPGLGHEDALARAVLVLSGSEAQSLEEVRAAMGLLAQVRGAVPRVGAAVDALLARAAEVEAAKLEADKNREGIAKRYFEMVRERLDERMPGEALRHLHALLRGSLADTRFARENARALESLEQNAAAMLREQGWLGLWPDARVRDNPLGTTTAAWTFARETQLAGFLPPEDGGPRYYGIQPVPPETPPAPPAPGESPAPSDGRLVFVAPPPGTTRELRDSPLVLDSPFQMSRPITVSFLYCSEKPLYLQVSVCGNHVGILNDDGSRTGGRGVHAWQALDWRNPDDHFPDTMRHDYIERNPRVLTTPNKAGERYFQLEPGRAYRVRVELDRGVLRLFVDEKPVWERSFEARHYKDDPPRIRIVTFTPAWLDDLVVEGTPDPSYRERLLRKR